MSIFLVALVAFATGLVILGWAGLSLLAWSHGMESRLPLDADDDADLRLAKAGLDVAYGAVPILAGALLLGFATSPVPVPPVSTSWLAPLASIAYVAMYFGFVRPRIARYRTRLRAAARAGA